MPGRTFGGQLRSILAVLILASALAGGRAEAGRRAFLFAYDSEIVPEGDVELEQWWWAESRIPASAEMEMVAALDAERQPDAEGPKHFGGEWPERHHRLRGVEGPLRGLHPPAPVSAMQ